MSAATDFKIEIDQAFADQLESLRDAVEYVAIQAIRRLDLKSPVDTGRFRANWTFSIGAPDGSITAAVDPAGARTVSANISAAASYPVDGKFPDFYVQNNLPYAEVLELGHSAQAPAGIVAITVAELEALMQGIEI